MAGGPRRVSGTSQIALRRYAREWTQADLARHTGIPLRTIQRLEQGRLRNPGICYLQNIAIALGVDLDDILRPEWRDWTVLHAAAPQPPQVQDS